MQICMRVTAIATLVVAILAPALGTSTAAQAQQRQRVYHVEAQFGQPGFPKYGSCVNTDPSMIPKHCLSNKHGVLHTSRGHRWELLNMQPGGRLMIMDGLYVLPPGQYNDKGEFTFAINTAPGKNALLRAIVSNRHNHFNRRFGLKLGTRVTLANVYARFGVGRNL